MATVSSFHEMFSEDARDYIEQREFRERADRVARYGTSRTNAEAATSMRVAWYLTDTTNNDINMQNIPPRELLVPPALENQAESLLSTYTHGSYGATIRVSEEAITPVAKPERKVAACFKDYLKDKGVLCSE